MASGGRWLSWLDSQDFGRFTPAFDFSRYRTARKSSDIGRTSNPKWGGVQPFAAVCGARCRWAVAPKWLIPSRARASRHPVCQTAARQVAKRLGGDQRKKTEAGDHQ